MGLLDKIGISKANEDGAPSRDAQKETKQSRAKKGSRGGLRALAGKAGVQVEQLPSADEQATAERHHNIRLAWLYLRHMVDKGVREYYASGSSPILEQYVERPLLDRLTDHLAELRASGIYWEQHKPRRRDDHDPVIDIIDETLDADGVPTEFVIRERFHDLSIYQQLEQDAHSGETVVTDSRQAEGEELAFYAEVVVLGDDEYRIRALRRDMLAVL